MTIQERLLSGKANVVFNPAHNEATGEYEIALLIDGDYIDSFPPTPAHQITLFT